MRVLSDVYPPHIKPVRDGWYLTGVKLEYGLVLREFRHGSWRYPNGAAVAPGYSHHWRGIAFDPAAPQERYRNSDIERRAPARREEMAAFAAELKADPAKALKFFQGAGILNERGELTPQYGGPVATCE